MHNSEMNLLNDTFNSFEKMYGTIFIIPSYAAFLN